MFLNTTTKEARNTLFLVFEFTLVLEFPQTKKKVLEDLKRHKSCNINSQLQKKFFFFW